jgi:hypothetical protein
MDFIFIKSSKAGKEDYGSIYARVRTGKANMKVVTGFTIKQLNGKSTAACSTPRQP